MIFASFVALFLGIAVGLWGEFPLLEQLLAQKDYILYGLMFVVGISVGLHKGLLAELRAYSLSILCIPLGTMVGSLLGGGICAMLVGHELYEGLAIASGLGWYSLSGVSISNLGGIELGSIAFLSNLFRELLAFLLIPLIAKYGNDYSCIAAAAATSEDTALPVLMKYTNPTVVVVAIFSGVLCSAVVPVLISLCFAMA